PATPTTAVYTLALHDALPIYLSGPKRAGLIGEWHDRRIVPGDDWAGQIDQHLQTADIILLLVSADFIASPYCYDVELRQAMQRQDRKSTRLNSSHVKISYAVF